MLTLKNVGKIYTKEGNVNKALDGINLSFDIGEFVAITGKSGSGKSTLLNVISGLDSYEEGEMYLNGKPTSHFNKEDFEEYNLKYISFIFQDYNILESFTVLENVEFALTSIGDLKKRKAKAKEIIHRVGLDDRMNTKGSFLSGGEKQRTVIARAIAKDSPVILADEPTGNLDTKTAIDVLNLLKEISTGKLVIIVTHNYEDVKGYATRHIALSDGKVEVDERFDDKDINEKVVKYDKYDFSDAHEYVFKKKNRSDDTHAYVKDAVMLGVKRYASRPKQAIVISLLLSIVLVFIFLLVGSTYSGSMWFTHTNIKDIDGRVIVARTDGKFITEAEASALKEKSGAKDVIMNDLFLDSSGSEKTFELNKVFYDEYEAYDRTQFALEILDEGCKKPTKGELPKADGDVVVRLPYNMKFPYEIGDTLYAKYKVMADASPTSVSIEVKIVGIEKDLRTKDMVPTLMVTRSFYDKVATLLRNKPYVVFYNNYGEGGSLDIMPIMLDGIIIAKDRDIKARVVANSQMSGNIMNINYKNKAGEVVPVEYVVDQHQEISTMHLIVGSEYYDNFAINRGSGQISLMFNDNNAKKSFLASDDYHELKMLDPANYDMATKEENLLSTVFKLVKNINVILLTFVMAFVLSVSIQKLLYATKGDIAIFRTMGISSKTVKRSTYVQLFMTLIPAYILVTVIALLMYFTTIGGSFYVMGIGSAVMLFVCSAVILLMLAHSYNKILYNSKISKNLRRVNK